MDTEEREGCKVVATEKVRFVMAWNKFGGGGGVIIDNREEE